MKTVYLIILLALVGWKGYHAWLRGRKSWTQDMQQYQSLWEYLLGNGATLQEARKPFIKRALSFSHSRRFMVSRLSARFLPYPTPSNTFNFNGSIRLSIDFQSTIIVRDFFDK